MVERSCLNSSYEFGLRATLRGLFTANPRRPIIRDARSVAGLSLVSCALAKTGAGAAY